MSTNIQLTPALTAEYQQLFNSCRIIPSEPKVTPIHKVQLTVTQTEPAERTIITSQGKSMKETLTFQLL